MFKTSLLWKMKIFCQILVPRRHFEVNPIFLNSPTYYKRSQSLSDRNFSVDFLFNTVKDKMLERVAVPKTRSAES